MNNQIQLAINAINEMRNDYDLNEDETDDAMLGNVIPKLQISVSII